MKEKLVVVVMGQNCEKFIKMCLNSVKGADKIIYCDGGSTDKTLDIVRNKIHWEEPVNDKIIENKYDQEDPTMNGKQRNFYLNYLKEHFKGWWCLCIDADEVVEDIEKLKDYIQFAAKDKLYSVKMRHFIGDLSNEDATQDLHLVPHRLFYVGEDLKYPEVEHPVLQGDRESIGCLATTIWHLAYIPNLFEYKKKYDNHLKKSNMHTPEYLKSWYYSHIFGQYPKKPISLIEIPKTILDHFGVNKDELYFSDRGLELKHFIDAISWRDFFQCKDAIEIGCGRGPRVFSLNQIGVDTVGIEISEFAVNNSFIRDKVQKGDILKEQFMSKSDLVIAYDVLEHLEKKDLNKAIENLIFATNKHILISVPFKGTPNCDNDPTHIIKEDKEWWIKQFIDKGLKLIETPPHFLFKEQVLIFENESEIRKNK